MLDETDNHNESTPEVTPSTPASDSAVPTRTRTTRSRRSTKAQPANAESTPAADSTVESVSDPATATAASPESTQAGDAPEGGAQGSSFAPKGRTRKAPTRRRTAAAGTDATPQADSAAAASSAPTANVALDAPTPVSEAPVAQSAPSSETVSAHDVSSDQSSVEPAAAEPPVKATRSRRGRTPRLLASAQLVSETAAPAAEVVDVVQASGVEQVDQVERGQATETTATETTDGSPDPIGEALTALGRSRRGRTPRATRVVVEETSEGALDSLVQAIASSIDPDEDDDESEDAPSRRRRRRRGGRKRHREATEVAEDGETEATTTEEDTPSQDGDEDPSEDQGRRRRRRRRRRGEDVEDGDDQDAEVVVKVREPRSSKSKSTDIIGIDGSTRLEAKKQRRREGRAASRQRAPILSEAEFLARREAVERKMLIRQKAEYSQIAVIEDGVLVEHYVDRASATSLIGNIYLGKVQNVLPGMEAAFIDIGRGRNAVLYAGEVDWDSFGEKGQNRKIEDVFSAGQLAVVQVSKDPVGAKGARLTSHISIPGRYVVYAPKGHISGISRKLSETERNRLKSILDTLVDDAATVVIRTAAEGATEDELVHDVNRLKAQWEVIEKKSTGKQAPQLLYAEPDLTMRIVRDLFTGDFASLIVDGNGGMEDAYETVEAYVQHVAPHLADRIQRWDHDNSGDLFAQNRIDEQIAKALDRKVHLPSGGSLVIDRTEAMTVIDVNTGKFTGSGGNLEATVTSNNLEAAEEIVRQLRLRDIGGIIIVDFIDMVLPSNRELLLRRLVECLGRDRTRHQVSEVTSLGLVQLTRKKVGTGLAEAFTKVCEVCGGLGHIRFDEPVDTQAPADGGERHQARRGGRRRS